MLPVELAFKLFANGVDPKLGGPYGRTLLEQWDRCPEAKAWLLKADAK